MLIDTHCHLSSKKFRKDLREVIKGAEDVGVKKIILPATNYKDAVEIINICKNHAGLKAAIGIYPGEIRKQGEIDRELQKIKKLIDDEKKYVVGIGEIGLDAYWLERQKTIEVELCKKQMEMGARLRLPVVIHQRDTEEEMWKLMKEMPILPQGHFHCWSGSDEFLSYVLEQGFYIGFCGNVTYKANQKLREQTKMVPRERLLLETDSPYLPPIGKRGERNTPSNVKITAQVIAEVLGMTLEELGAITTNNAERLYSV